MPNRDGTGPEGKGPKTGRQRGNCEGAKPQSNFGRGKGFKRQNTRIKCLDHAGEGE